jgi:uncharacterized DUF497 family protein
MADFEWDPNKETHNLRKHHIDFTTASFIWNGPVLERADERRDYGETGVLAIGEVENRTLVVVFTPHGEVRRIISVRKANRRDKKLFEEEIRRRSPP